MDKLARLSPQDRRDIFSEAAAKLGIRPTIIEKDFWVCLTLKLLFLKSRFRESLVFKGGTSLSKVHGLIERFSEDIDLVLDWKLIGFGEGLKDPMQSFDSKSKQDKFNKEINRLAANFIAQILCPEVDDLVEKEEIGLSAAVDEVDPHVVIIRYPAAFSEGYIRPEVRLEIGPLAPGCLPPSIRLGPMLTPYCRKPLKARLVKL
jgi:Nucleotidyl transferase AbiEii toxin, Type IV TA system